MFPLFSLVVPGLVPDIHALLFRWIKDVDGRVKPGHDDGNVLLRVANSE